MLLQVWRSIWAWTGGAGGADRHRRRDTAESITGPAAQGGDDLFSISKAAETHRAAENGGVSFPPPLNRISMSLHYIFKWHADVKAAAAAARPGDTGHILMTGKWDLKGQRLRSFHLTCATKQETKHTHKNLFCSEFTMKQDYFFSR